MAQHLMTVCVVCVLCAAHNPCSAHTTISPVIVSSQQSINKISNNPAFIVPIQPVNNAKDDLRTTATHDKGRLFSSTPDDNYEHFFQQSTQKIIDGKRKNTKKLHHTEDIKEDILSNHEVWMNDPQVLKMLGQTESIHSEDYKNEHFQKQRAKRHADIEERYFLKKIFNLYGDGGSLSMEGFEKMLKNLGLLQLIANFGRQKNSTKTNSSLVAQTQSNIEPSHAIDSKHKCLSREEFLTSLAPESSLSKLTKNDTIIPGWLFERMCPVLLYHLASSSHLERNGCVLFPDNYKEISSMDDMDGENARNMVQVWVYSTISIVIISLCGLLGVAVIPVMGKSYYHQLIQFLVALAIGTLCGDALIHLLPHAMMSPHSHELGVSPDEINEEELHNLNMWKGLVAMMGLILFFFTEKALTMIAEWRKHHQRKSKLPTRVRVMRESEGPNSNSVGEKLCKHKYSSYPYCYGEITTDTRDDHHEHNDKERLPGIEEAKPLTSDCNPVSKIIKEDLEKSSGGDWKLDGTGNGEKKPADSVEVAADVDGRESYTVIIREHENKHHGHTHSHGHVHAAPESMSSVAWMVIMGDGLHNFTDGMAIGAAFAANIAGGFSTAIAVFCHELPHELGDFAVLLKAGMSAKQAVFYNLLSSVLCLFGMIFGVLLGASPSTTSWIFALAAGMFIYIALVDMIPELSTGHAEEGGSRLQCILQALGLVSGLGIMLIIALYEHDLQHMFNH